MSLTKLGIGRQIAIPKDISEKYGLKAGDYVEVTAEEEKIVVTPKKHKVHYDLPVGEAQMKEGFELLYDYKVWQYKVIMLKALLDDPALRKSILSSSLWEGVDTSEFEDFLKYEIHFTLYHAAEAFFAFIFAYLYGDKNPWLWLSEYDLDSLQQNIQKIGGKKGLSAIIKQDKIEDFIMWLFYPAARNNLSKIKKKELKESCQFIRRFIEHLAKEFTDRGDYNAYKHGFRAFRIKQQITIGPTQDGKKLVFDDLEGVRYLALKESLQDDSIIKKIRIVTKGINVERSFRIIFTIGNLLRAAMEQRRVNLKILKGILPKPQKLSVPIYKLEHLKSIFAVERGQGIVGYKLDMH